MPTISEVDQRSDACETSHQEARCQRLIASWASLAIFWSSLPLHFFLFYFTTLDNELRLFAKLTTLTPEGIT